MLKGWLEKRGVKREGESGGDQAKRGGRMVGERERENCEKESCRQRLVREV